MKSWRHLPLQSHLEGKIIIGIDVYLDWYGLYSSSWNTTMVHYIVTLQKPIIYTFYLSYNLVYNRKVKDHYKNPKNKCDICGRFRVILSDHLWNAHSIFGIAIEIKKMKGKLKIIGQQRKNIHQKVWVEGQLSTLNQCFLL